MSVEPETIAELFTRASGKFAFARWGRPIAPVVFGVAEETLPVIKGVIEAVVTLADHKTADPDPELGANLMMFLFRDGFQLLKARDLPQLWRPAAG